MEWRAVLAASGSFAFLRVAEDCWVCGAGPFERRAHPPASGIAFYVNDFSLASPEPWLIPARSWQERTIAAGATAPLSISWRNLMRGGFEDCYEEIIAGIRAGLLHKAVLVLAERGHLVEGTPEAIIARTLAASAAPFGWAYGFAQADDGFAGMTPECLFTLCGKRLHTMALAGTAKPAEQVDFQADPKEIREHQLVVDSLRSKLDPFGDVRQGPREILNVGDLLHFITRFQMDASELDIESALRLLHPTPAIGVLPATPENRARLLSWRDRLGTPGQFGAPFGVKWHGGFHAVVTIRGISWKNGDLFLPAGCGIVEGSQLEREWRELALKRDWVKRALSLA